MSVLQYFLVSEPDIPHITRSPKKKAKKLAGSPCNSIFLASNKLEWKRIQLLFPNLTGFFFFLSKNIIIWDQENYFLKEKHGVQIKISVTL